MSKYNSVPVAADDAKEKDRLDKAHNAMMKRLEGIEDNDLIESVLQEEQDEDNGVRDERYSQWEVVQDLVSTACSRFVDGEVSLNKTLTELADALQKLAKK